MILNLKQGNLDRIMAGINGIDQEENVTNEKFGKENGIDTKKPYIFCKAFCDPAGICT